MPRRIFSPIPSLVDMNMLSSMSPPNNTPASNKKRWLHVQSRDDLEGDDYRNHHDKFQRVGSKDSCPSAAFTSLATVSYANESWDDFQEEIPSPPTVSKPLTAPTASEGLSLKHKTKSILTLPLMLLPSRVTTDCSEAEDDASIKFEDIISHELKKACITDEQGKNNNSVDFISNSSLRNAMEPFLAVARKLYDLLCYCGLLCMKTKVASFTHYNCL